MAKNERTSKRVSEQAAWLLKHKDDIELAVARLRTSATVIDSAMHCALSVAGSALTQSPDKPKRVRR